MRREIRLFTLAAGIALAAAGGCAPRPTSMSSTIALKPDPTRNLRADVCYLASDSLGGRLEGTPGIDMAAEYIAAEMRRVGARPLFGDSYFQEFQIQFGFEIEGHPVFRIEDASLDYSVLPISGSGTVWGSAVIGTAASDAKDARLAGKVLFCWEHPELERQRWTVSGHDALLEWMKEFATRAADVKAGAVIFVSGSSDNPDAGFHFFALPKTFAPAPIPCLEIRHSSMAAVLATQGVLPDSLAHLITAVARDRGWRELPGIQCELGLTTAPRSVTVKNVGCVLPGTTKATEYVAVGAHYDHLGLGDIGSMTPWRREVHNGADDNASGVGALLEVARKLAAGQAHPRSIAFLSFTAEELGAVGSEYFCANCPYPFDSTVAFVNLDTVGRLEANQLVVFGATSASEMPDVLKKSDQGIGLALAEKADVFGFSDQNPFYARHIPSLHLFTGANTDYHTPDDDCENINFEGLAVIASFAGALTANLAASETHLTPVIAAEQPSQGAQGPSMRGRGGFLGIVPDFAYGGQGIRIKGTVPSSPAEAAGLQDGDILLKLDGQAVSDLQQLMNALGSRNPGDQITLEVNRGGAVITKQVTLSVRSAN
jgi:Peptidase family M28/PDZ domain